MSGGILMKMKLHISLFLGLIAGITQQFLDRPYRQAMRGALADNLITEAAIDSVIKGNFRVMIKLGLLDPPEMVPYSSIGVSDTLEPWLSDKHKSIARKVTRKTFVLLKNANNTLPLDKNKIKSIAVIGPRAEEVLLDWYSGTPPYTVGPLEGIKNKVGANVKVDYNSGGRLVQTWPKSIDQLPDMMDYNIRNGRTYMYFKGEPLYPFGYGLSYTTFKYSNLTVSSEQLGKNSEILVRVDVTNMGERAGDEVVQLYVKHLESKVERPLKELRGFKRISIQPKETKTVEIPLKAETLAYWDEKKTSLYDRGRKN